MDSHHTNCCSLMFVLLGLLLVLGASYVPVVCSGQVFAAVTVVAGEAFEGNQKVLTCRYVINETYIPVPTLTGMLWRKGSDGVGFLPPVGAPTYEPGYNEPEYVISTVDIDAGCDLTIQSVAQTDSGMYTCVVYVSYSGLDRENPKSANLTVSIFVPPTTITVSYDGVSYNNGTSITVVAGDNHQFTCSTPGVYPDAIFTWTLPTGSSTDQPQGTQTSSPNAGDISLVDSSNTLSISIPEKPATAQLICGATNRQDGSSDTEIHITVALQVKVPPKMVSLSDSNGDIGASLTVNQGALHNLQCLVQGTRPAASIEWFLDSVTPSTGVRTPLETKTDELWDTTGFWSFTPSRSHHKQVVKCEAKTNESKSIPSDSATIDVIGPPNTPAITPTSPMTEGVATTLTCKADMAFPDDWSLVWSKDGTVTPGQAQPTTDQRYNFTSTLSFEPVRADNGNTITCTAQRDSLSPSPEGSLGPLNVQFCAETLSLTPCASVVAGNTASMRCVSGSSNPATTLTWFKDSVNVTSPTNRPNYDGEDGGRKTKVTYTTDVLDKSHNGSVYKCCATNTAITSCDLCESCTLIVKYPPEFSQATQFPDTPIVEGNSVILTCSADANPMLHFIRWQKDGSDDVPGTVEYNDGTSTLTISNTTRGQAGYYRCRANNGIPTSDGTSDVLSDNVTLIVHYEPIIMNKAANEVGVKVGENAELLCNAVGNPRPSIKWLSPNNTEISNDMTKYTVNETPGGDGVFQYEVNGTLTIHDVDSQLDYGQYTCIASNGIGTGDSLKINVTGPRQPDKPSAVIITDRTSSSLSVRWTAGYDGGKDQWFNIAHLKAGDSETVSGNITGNEYTVTGLESYTDYDIRVYAHNAIGKNPDYAETNTTTLPNPPGKDSGILVEFNENKGTVQIKGLDGKDGCIQMEVQYSGSNEWSRCGECTRAKTVELDKYCPKPQQTRRKRAVGDVADVRASRCRGDLCSDPVVAERVKPSSPNIAIIVGGVVGCLVLLAIIGCLVYYLRKTSPQKQKDVSCSSIELQGGDTKSDNGISNEGLQSSVTGNTAIYAQVNKGNKAKSVKASGNANVTDEEKIKYPKPAPRSSSRHAKTPEKEEVKTSVPTTESGSEDTNISTNKGDSKPLISPKPTITKRGQKPEEEDSYLVMNNKPPARPEKPRNLPDVTYAVVDKEKKKQPPPPPTQGDSKPSANKKKPKKYVPPSRAEEESAYEDVMVNGKKAANPPPKEPDDTYANFGDQQQENSGRVVNEDGLIYAEVGHTKVHPPDQPPIQTEESTAYASLDFGRMKTNVST